MNYELLRVAPGKLKCLVATLRRPGTACFAKNYTINNSPRIFSMLSINRTSVAQRFQIGEGFFLLFFVSMIIEIKERYFGQIPH